MFKRLKLHIIFVFFAATTIKPILAREHADLIKSTFSSLNEIVQEIYLAKIHPNRPNKEKKDYIVFYQHCEKAKEAIKKLAEQFKPMAPEFYTSIISLTFDIERECRVFKCEYDSFPYDPTKTLKCTIDCALEAIDRLLKMGMKGPHLTHQQITSLKAKAIFLNYLYPKSNH